MRSINFQKKSETNIFPIRTKQASSIKDLLLWLLTNLQTAKPISISKLALQRRKKGTNDFQNVIFAEVFAKIISKNKGSTSYKNIPSSKILPKHDLVRFS